MNSYLHNLSRRLRPLAEEKLPAGERLLLLGLLLLGLGLFVFLTGDTAERLGLIGWFSLSEHLGFYCPACGGTRALNLLLQGQLALAWRYNQLFVAALPLLGLGGLALLRSVLTGYPLTRSQVPDYWLWLLLGAILLFTVLRNLPFPAFDYLRPPAY